MDRLELIPLMARVQSGMVALARPINGDDVTGVVTFAAGESVIYVTDIFTVFSLPGKPVYATVTVITFVAGVKVMSVTDIIISFLIPGEIVHADIKFVRFAACVSVIFVTDMLKVTVHSRETV